jgi:hypothetical protein
MDDEPDPSTVGEPITVEFRVRGPGGMPTGEVVVTLSGGEETCSGTLTNGNGSCDLTPTAAGPSSNNNRRVITATYQGDAQFTGSTDTDNHRVNPAPASGPSASRSSVDAPESIPAGSPGTVTVTVRDASGAVLAGIPVSVSSSGTDNVITPSTANTDVNGVATFTFSSTAAGDKTITATAGGVTIDDQPTIQVSALSSTVSITADDPDPSAPGQVIRVTFAVTGEGGGTPSGTVAIFSFDPGEGGQGCEAAPVGSDGTGFCDMTLTQPGPHTIQATYSGNAQYESSTDPDGAAHEVTP